MRTATELHAFIGRKLRIFDNRVGAFHETIIVDAREYWGKLQLQVEGSVKWFEPTSPEMKSLEERWFD
jgi:hypothetical protein